MLKLFLITPSITGGFVLPIRRTRKTLHLYKMQGSFYALSEHYRPLPENPISLIWGGSVKNNAQNSLQALAE